MRIPAIFEWKLNVLLCLTKYLDNEAKKIHTCLRTMEHFTVYILATIHDWKFNASGAVGSVKQSKKEQGWQLS